MVYGGYGYIDTKYTPGKDEFVTLLWIKGTEPLEKLAEGIASESSVGTWTGIQTMNKFVWDNLRARIFWLHKSDSKSGFVKIAYPLEHFDHDNILQLLASIRGNIFGMKELTELEVLDWSIPAKYQKRFPGPCQGIEGVRKYLGTDKTRRPHVGTIVKPKVGLKPAEFAKVAQNAFMGGLDLVKDDENLVNQEFCRWEDRAVKTIDVAEKAKAETGNSKIYLSNITDFVPNMLKRIDFLNAIGWKMAMIDVYVIGLAGLQHVLTELHKKKFIVHAHRAGYAAETRGKFGVSFMFWEKLYRLLGVDQLHTGTGVGKMEGSPIPIRWLGETLRQ
ncbi:MAG: ribulose-bisphosphate carboxylase large subunit, partial [Candidatus Altiarchaeota archaeon]|nr:ribulose-bisphosphate carboxylase large subunit [Candidatus Altiarchaeota archaeon]